MYNLGLYIDGPELANGINDLFDAVRVRDPFETIEDVVERNRFQLFWEILLKTVTCPPVPSNIVTEYKLDSICRFAFI
jgi:hypothetical protein